MSDFKITNKVVQANELVQQANWNMNAVPLKIFKTVVSCIDTKNPKQDVYITKQELAKFLGIGENYTYLRTQIESLQKQIVKIKKGDEIISLSVLPKVKYKKNDDVVICHFDEDIMPYLAELKGYFLQYDVANLKSLDSKYGIIIYEWLLSKERQENATSETNKKHEYIITIDELRRLTGTEKSYSRFKDLEKYVLKSATDDINKPSGLEFLMKYEKIKKGRQITHIKFTIRKRTSISENEFDQVKYIERLNDKI